MRRRLTSWADDAIGELLASLKDNDLDRNTIICFLSDHGDNLGSHHLFNKGQIIEESIRVPLIFHAPERFSPRVNTQQVAQIIDVMPTLLDLCDIEKPSSVQGKSLLPLLHGERETLDDEAGYIEVYGGQVAILTLTHLYSIRLAPDRQTIADDRDCFYDLRSDPYENNNLAKTDQRAELAAGLRRKLTEWHRRTPWLLPDC